VGEVLGVFLLERGGAVMQVGGSPVRLRSSQVLVSVVVGGCRRGGGSPRLFRRGFRASLLGLFRSES
jgi:hypothetical protein